MFNLKNQQNLYDNLLFTGEYCGILTFDAITFNEMQKSYDTESTIAVCNTNDYQALVAIIDSMYILDDMELEDGKVLYDCDVEIRRC